MSKTVFPDIDRERFLSDLENEGASFGLRLPPDLLSEILTFARENPCFADREEDKGFFLDNRASAEKELGKPILVAQYFNVATTCPAAEMILNDPLLKWVAGSYLGSLPVSVGTNLWWTFPVDASEEDRDRHAHLYHRDLDDFRFLKFFFYLTNVDKSDGGHIFVLGSHRKSPAFRFGDRWRIRRYRDSEINQMYGDDEILEVLSPAGAGFAENTLGVHKGLTPKRRSRLLLQFQFALFDYGVTNDIRSQALLKTIV